MRLNVEDSRHCATSSLGKLSLADSHELGRFTIYGLKSHSVCAMRAGMCEDRCNAVRARLSAWAVWHGICGGMGVTVMITEVYL